MELVRTISGLGKLPKTRCAQHARAVRFGVSRSAEEVL